MFKKDAENVLAAGVHTGNDFVRSEEEIQAPMRRGGLTAVSLLTHIPKEEVTRLGEKWGNRELRRSEFIELLLPIIASSPFFDSCGAKVISEWEKAGWISSASRTVWCHRKKSNAFRALSSEDKRMSFRDKMRLVHTKSTVKSSDLPFSANDDIDIVNYLHDVFSAIDSGRQGSASWEQFTLFLIDGIVETSLAQTAQHGDDDQSAGVSYVFRGELPALKSAFARHELSHEWFSKMTYIPELDKLLCVSKNQVFLIPISSSTDFRNAVVLNHSEDITAAAYLPNDDITLTHTLAKQICTVWQHSAKHAPKEVLSMRFSDSYVTSIQSDPLHDRTWTGHRNGEVVSSSIARDAGGRYSIRQNVVAKYDDCVTAMELLPHNGFLASASMDSTVHILDPTGFSKEAVLRKHQHGVSNLAFSSTVGVLLTAGFEEEIFVWADNLWSEPVFPLRDLVRPFTASIIALCPIPSTSYVAAADASGVLKLFDLRSRQAVLSLSICDTNNFENGLIRRDQLRSEAEPLLSHHRKDPKMFASMAFTGTLHRHFVFGGSRLFYFSPSADVAENPHLSSDIESPIVSVQASDLLGVITASTKDLTVWSLKTGLPDIRHTRLSSSKITSVTMRPTCDIVITGCEDGSVAVHQASSGLRLQHYSCHDDPVTALALHPVRPTLISFSKNENKGVFWNDSALLATNSVPVVQIASIRVLPKQTLCFDNPITCMEFAPAGEALLVCVHHALSVFTFNEVYSRWLLGTRISHGAVSGLEHAQFLPSSGQEEDEEGITVYFPLAVDNRGFAVLWRVDIEHASDAVEHSLLCVWRNSSILASVPERRVGRRGSRPQSRMKQRQLLRDSVARSSAIFEAAMEDTQLQQAMERLENCAETPPLRCCATDCVFPFLLYTGDDLGRVTVWLLPPFYPPMESRYNPLCPWPQPEVLTTFCPHSQPLVSMKICKQPFHCLITCGQDNVVVFSAWHGAELARLEQGPLVERHWFLARQLVATKPKSMLALVRWCRIKHKISTGDKHWIPSYVTPESTPFATARTTPSHNTPGMNILSMSMSLAAERRMSRGFSLDMSTTLSGSLDWMEDRRVSYAPKRKPKPTTRLPRRLLPEPNLHSKMPPMPTAPTDVVLTMNVPPPRRQRDDLSLRNTSPDRVETKSPDPSKKYLPHISPRPSPNLLDLQSQQRNEGSASPPPFVEYRARLHNKRASPLLQLDSPKRSPGRSPRSPVSPPSSSEEGDDGSVRPFTEFEEVFQLRPVQLAARPSKRPPVLRQLKVKQNTPVLQTFKPRRFHTMVSRKKPT